LEAPAIPDRAFDIVVIGEPSRANYASQFGLTFPVFVHYGVELWVPIVGGKVEPDSGAHDLVTSLYGGMSKGERNRITVRVRRSMEAPCPCVASRAARPFAVPRRAIPLDICSTGQLGVARVISCDR
jgi:hypothetical protein